MKQFLIFSVIICVLVVFWACSKDSNPVTSVNRTFDPFSLWDTASGALGNLVQCMTAKDTNLFAGTGNSGIYRSTNNGDTWIQVNTGLASMNVFALFVKDSIVLAGTSGNGIDYSTDNGSHWLPSNTTTGSVYSFIQKDSAIFAGIAHAVYKSTDNGLTWTSVGSFSSNVTALAVRSSKLIAGTSANGVYRSTNNGTNWTAINTGLSSTSITSLAVKDTMIFATTGSGVYRSSKDSSWTIIDDGLYSALSGSSPVPIYVVYSNILVGFSNLEGVYLSLNNGTSWVSCNAGFTPPFSALAFTYNGSYLFVGGQSQGGTGAVWRHGL